jgi:hypothetical protein
VNQPKVISNHIFHPQPVEIIQPIEIVNRHHCVPVPYVVNKVFVRDVFVPGIGAAAPQGSAHVSGVRNNKGKRKK